MDEKVIYRTGWTSTIDKTPDVGQEVLISDSWCVAVGHYDGKGWVMTRHVTMLYPTTPRYWMDINSLLRLPKK